MGNSSTFKDKKVIDKKETSPSDKTLDFLKMFARSYYVDKKLPTALNGVVIN